MKLFKVMVCSLLTCAVPSICTETKKEEIMENTHTVVVVLEAKSGQESVLKNELLKIMKLSCQQPGCLEYRVHEDKNNPAQFVLYETWKNVAAHQAQLEQPYIHEFMQKKDGFLAKQPQIILSKTL